MFTSVKRVDRIAADLLRVYLLFWMPRVILNVASGKIEMGGYWLTPDAEDLYKRLESLLARESPAKQLGLDLDEQKSK